MEYRKIQLTGGATYTVSLPNEWVKKKKLSKGSKIGFTETSRGGLLLKTEDEGELREIKLEIEQDMHIDFIERLLITRYIQGYDTISVVSKRYIQPEIRKKQKEVSRGLLGLEAFGETANELTFKVLLQKDIDLIASIHQMCSISLSSFQELTGCLSEKNEELVADILQREAEIDKFYFLVLRQFYLGREQFDLGWFQIAKSIERISDHIENIATMSLNLGNKPGKNDIKLLLSLYAQLTDTYSKVIDLINERNNFTAVKANEIITRITKLQKNEQADIHKLMEIQKIDPYSLLIHESFRRISGYVSDIAEVILNLSQ